jgi:hypothetical protein
MYKIHQLIANTQYVVMLRMDFLRIRMLKLNHMVVKIVIVLQDYFNHF